LLTANTPKDLDVLDLFYERKCVRLGVNESHAYRQTDYRQTGRRAERQADKEAGLRID